MTTHHRNIPTSELPLYSPDPKKGGPEILSFGGGHGLYAALRAFRLLTENLTAVVTVADDGGSSGRLREEFGGLPPGDLRMALAALCDDGEWGKIWRDVIQYRFKSNGDLDDHTVGNILITALWQQLGDHVAGLDWMARLVRAHGRVLPMSSVPLAIEADVATPDGSITTIVGQSQVAKCSGDVQEIRLNMDAPPACPETLEAIAEAKVLNFGPGSWFTSVMPHLLVPELVDAVINSRAMKMLTLNMPEAGDDETVGMTHVDLLQALYRHARGLHFDYIVVDRSSLIGSAENAAQSTATSTLTLATQPAELAAASGDLFGAQLWSADVAGRRSGVHDSLKLAACYRDILVDSGIYADD